MLMAAGVMDEMELHLIHDTSDFSNQCEVWTMNQILWSDHIFITWLHVMQVKGKAVPLQAQKVPGS